MQTAISKLKRDIAKLPKGDFEKLMLWLHDFVDSQELKELSDDSKGIRHQDVLKTFTKRFGTFRRLHPAYVASFAASDMEKFYKDTRVRGCAFENDADMLMAAWGAVSEAEFHLAYTRQLIPPVSSGEEEIWQLKLDMRFPLTDDLKRVKEGSRWFRSLRQLNAFSEFVFLSPVGRRTAEAKPDRVLLSYENVE